MVNVKSDWFLSLSKLGCLWGLHWFLSWNWVWSCVLLLLLTLGTTWGQLQELFWYISGNMLDLIFLKHNYQKALTVRCTSQYKLFIITEFLIWPKLPLVFPFLFEFYLLNISSLEFLPFFPLCFMVVGEENSFFKDYKYYIKPKAINVVKYW